MRSFISRAALLVKVTARICEGKARPVAQDVGDAGGQHARLAGAGAGQHQHRAVQRLDRLALLGVEAVEIGRAGPARRNGAGGQPAGPWGRRGGPGRRVAMFGQCSLPAATAAR